ncbi:putative ribonuclease H-like domain-containing protein, partial [Tanacetum coccineum]
PKQEYILIPIYTTNPLISQVPKDSKEDARVKPTELDESEALDKDGKDDQDTGSEFERLLQLEKQANSTNSFNTVGTPVSAAGPSFTNDNPSSPVNVAEASNAFEKHLFERFSPFKNKFTLLPVLNVTPMDDTGIFGNAYDNEDIIGDLTSAIQTRRMTKISYEHAMLDRSNARGASTISTSEDLDTGDLPNGKRAIGTKWVFRNKKDERGIVIRNKMYVKSSSLYGTIEEEVYVCQPPGFEDPQFPDKVYKVEKALYGLHQAPRAWYETLSTYLIENGFRRGTIDNTLFIKKDKGDIFIRDSDEFYGELTFHFVYTRTAESRWNQHPQDKDKDWLLMYLMAFRPDIMFVVCACARFQVTPKVSHLHAVKRIFRYLTGQSKLGLWYPTYSPFDLEAFSDSD